MFRNFMAPIWPDCQGFFLNASYSTFRRSFQRFVYLFEVFISVLVSHPFCSHSAMACGSGQDHSTFESVTNQLFTHRSSFPENPGMQVVFSDEKQVNFQKTELEVVVQDQDSPEYPANSDAQCNLPPQPRRKWLLYGGVAAILIVVAAVLGGVLGWRANKKSPSESFSTLSSSTSSNVPSPFPSFNAITTIQSQRKLAAVSYAVNSVDNTRVYYQDNAGEIVEAASSAKSSTWINIKLGFFAKNGSAIGAAVSRPGFTHVSFDFVFAGWLAGQSSDIRLGNYFVIC